MPMYRGKHVICNMYFSEVESLFVVTEERKNLRTGQEPQEISSQSESRGRAEAPDAWRYQEGKHFDSRRSLKAGVQLHPASF